MKLPNLENAFVEERKIIGYLLNEEKSGGKTAFFAAFGFTVGQWETLRAALLYHAARYEVARSTESLHGAKYIIEGEMSTPDGRLPKVRSVWIIDAGQTAPRLVTAYPLEGDSE